MKSLYVLDLISRSVVRVDPRSGETSTAVEALKEIPDGIVVSPAEQRIYWTNMGRFDSKPEPGQEPPFETTNASIECAALDGSDRRTVLEIGSFTTGKQLALDADRGLLYWCDREGRAIWRARTDGSEQTKLVSTLDTEGGSMTEWPVGIAIDPAGGFLYWTQKGTVKGGTGRIFRAGLELPDGVDPGSRDDIETLWQSLPEPIDLDLSADGSRLYWTDRGAPPDGNSFNTAAVPPVGSTGEPPTVLARDFDEAIGLAVDEDSGVAYVGDLGGTIYEVRLDDGSKRAVVTGNAKYTGMALHD